MIKLLITALMVVESSGNPNAIGSVVKVGFLQLRVLSHKAVKDGLPDIYTLQSLDKTRLYEFVPYHGLTRIDHIN